MKSLWTGRLAVVLLLAAGCQAAEETPPPLYPVRGAAERLGKPVSSGGLIFLPQGASSQGWVVNANVAADGSFALETSRSSGRGPVKVLPGAPLGTYQVVYHPDHDGSRMGLEYTFPEPLTVTESTPPVKLQLPEVMPKGYDISDEPVETPTTRR